MPQIVLEVPEELKSLEGAIEEFIKTATSQLTMQKTGRVGYEAFERALEERSGALERAVHQAMLTALDVDAPLVEIAGKPYVRVYRGPTTYMSRSGEVEGVVRSLYRPSGARGGDAVDPVALRAGAIEGIWLPGAARAMAHLLQQGPEREAVKTAQQLGRLPYGKASFEVVGQAVARQYRERQLDIDEQLITSLVIPKGVRALSVALDRVNVPIEEPRPRPPGRPKKDAPKNPIRRVFRQAYCGTVTLHDEKGEAVYTIRYGCMPISDPEEVVNGMAGDVLALLAQRPGLPVVLLSDGAPEMHRLLDEAFQGDEFGVVLRLVDFWHLVEKLAAAIAVMVAADQKQALLAKWRLELLNRDDAPERILAELRASGRQNVRVGDTKPVHEAITYLENRGDRMGYAEARRRKLPIGSGAVESTCKSLASVRFKRSGCRWKQPSADRLIRIRALALSDRWDDAMDIILRTPPVPLRVLRAA